MHKRSPWHLYGSFFFLAPTVVWSVLAIAAFAQWYVSVGSHLSGAAISVDVEEAHRELGLAIKAMESRGMTEGYTSVLWKSEGDNVGAFYDRLKRLRKSISDEYEVEVVYGEGDGFIADGEPVALEPKAKAMMLEAQAFALEHLRHVLTDKEENVRTPEGISRFPENKGMASLFAAQFFCLFVGLYLLIRYATGK